MKKEFDIFDKPRNVKIMMALFYALLLLLLVVDPFVHKHAEFSWAGAPGFFAAYGFVACVIVITVAKMFRRFLMQREDYYKKEE